MFSKTSFSKSSFKSPKANQPHSCDDVTDETALQSGEQAISRSLADHFYEQFRAEGYALPQSALFSSAELAQLESLYQSMLEKGVNPDMPHIKHAELLQFLQDSRVADIVAPIVGKDAFIWASHFIDKPAKVGVKTPWHTDSDYWASKVHNIADIKLCTIWLALDDVDQENGCMGVIPQSHLTEEAHVYKTVEEESLFDSEIQQVDEQSAVWFTLKKGHYSLHDPRIIHGANPNRSERRRCGYTMRYISANVQLKDKDHPLIALSA